jgi:hypothetical protein
MELEFFNYSKSIAIEYNDGMYYLHAIKDEWFLLTVVPTKYRMLKRSHYKCDQFEGLMRCIEDKVLIETHIEESKTSSDYFEEISSDEFHASAILSTKLEDKDINFIKSIIKEDIKINVVIGKHHLHFTNNVYNILEMRVLSDEWWIVDYSTKRSSKYYKCDQLEGLEKLLKQLYLHK